MADHFSAVLRAAQSRVPKLLAQQVRDTKSFDHGGFFSSQDGLCHPGEAVGALDLLVSVFACPESQYYRNGDVQSSISETLAYIARIQRPDGTFDLLTTNFFSAPDTAFILIVLTRVYRIVLSFTLSSLWQSKLQGIIELAADGAAEGGFHTPNHRWVIAAALLSVYSLFGHRRLRLAAQEYLDEGIDCTPQGEYTERSAGIYNAVNNAALVIIADVLDDPAYLEPVRRSMDRLFYYLEPDGTVFTQNSARQDKGETGGAESFFPTRYYELSLQLAQTFSDGRYASLAAMVLSQTTGTERPACLSLFLANPKLRSLDIEPSGLPTNYERYWADSQIIRIRRNIRTLSLVTDRSPFAFIQVGELRCAVKFCASFFAVSQFRPTELKPHVGGYTMRMHSTGHYQSPLGLLAETSVWHQMDHRLRGTAKTVNLDMEVSVSETSSGWMFQFETKGCSRVPAKIELLLPNDATLHAEAFAVDAHPGGHLLLRSGQLTVRRGAYRIRVYPGGAAHTYTRQMRGSEPQSLKHFTVYFTDFTPVARRLYIEEV